MLNVNGKSSLGGTCLRGRKALRGGVTGNDAGLSVGSLECAEVSLVRGGIRDCDGFTTEQSRE
jgi:hypothetical protein